MDNLVIKISPIIAGDDDNCFTNAYADLTLADLIVSPEGEDNDTGKTCTAATKSKADLTADGDSTTNKFWGAATLEDAVGTDAIYFSASSCGIEGAVTDVSGTDYMQFKTTLMSSFDASAGEVLTQQEMLETDIICNYELSVDGIMVAIDPKLDAVDEDDKIQQDNDTNEIAETEVSTTITVDGSAYTDGDDVTLGSSMKIDFDSIGELTSGYYIDSCVADNEVSDPTAEAYKKQALVTDGCALTSTDMPLSTINPTLDATSTALTFEQFAFVDATSTFDAPVLKFELNCVLKFGTAPGCGGGRRRRDVARNSGDTADFTVSIPISADGSVAYADGVATAGQPKSADSGATEMLMSAMATAGFLLL